MPTTPAEIVAELSNHAECDDFTTYLTDDRNAAVFLQSSATQSLTNYASAADRQAEIADLTAQIADDRAKLPGIRDERVRLRAERTIMEQESRLLTLRTQALDQGGDDRARKHHERNGYEDRINRANILLPLVVVHRAGLAN